MIDQTDPRAISKQIDRLGDKLCRMANSGASNEEMMRVSDEIRGLRSVRAFAYAVDANCSHCHTLPCRCGHGRITA